MKCHFCQILNAPNSTMKTERCEHIVPPPRPCRARGDNRKRPTTRHREVSK